MIMIREKSGKRKPNDLSVGYCFLSAVLGGMLGVSFSLFAWSFAHIKRLADFLNNNAITYLEQDQILFWMVLGGSIGAICYLITSFMGKCLNKIFVQTKLNLITVLLLPICLVPGLFEKDFWHGNDAFMLFVALLLMFWCLSFLSYVAPPDRRQNYIKWRNALSLGALWAGIVCYSAYFSYYTILHHYQLGTSAFDLGLLENALRNTLEGNFMYSSYINKSYFAFHSFFIHLVWLPFYFFFPSTETLLILQSAVLAVAAWPLYLLAYRLLHHRVGALIIAFVYLLHPAQHGANFYDVHALCFLPLILFSMFYAFYTGRKKVFVFCSLALLLVKDDMGILLMTIAFFLHLVRPSWGRTFLMMLAAICGYMASNALHVWHNQAPTGYAFYYATYMVEGASGVSGLLRTVLTNPLYVMRHFVNEPKFIYLAVMFLPFALLPFFYWPNWLLIGYGLMIAMLGTASNTAVYSFSFQYVWYVIPTATVAAVMALRRFRVWAFNRQRRKRGVPDLLPNSPFKAGLVAMCLMTLIVSWQYGAILNRQYFHGGFRSVDFKFTQEERDKRETLMEIINSLPFHVSLSAGETIAPHANRLSNVDTFRYFDKETDYILLFEPNYENPLLYSQLIQGKKYFQTINKKGLQLLKKIETA